MAGLYKANRFNLVVMATSNGNGVLWTESVTTMARSSLRRMHVHVLQHDEGMMNACYSKNNFACV